MRRALVMTAVAATAVAGCSGGSHKSSSHSSGAPLGAERSTATRWWSNSAVSAGSKIDPAHPKAAAGKLHPSDTDYCGMLSDTLKARKSILPGASASDPALQQAATAFIAEIERVAPLQVKGAWDVLGTVIIALAKGGSTPTALPSMDTAAVTQAATTVATDAKKRCGLDLSQVTAANH